MNTKAVLAVIGLCGAPLAVAAQTVIYDFTGTGELCSHAEPGVDWTCVTGLAFTGTVTIEVLADAPSGPDSGTDGITTAYDENGWVQSHFVIRWDNHVFEPAPLPGPQEYSQHAAGVENDAGYPGAVYSDTLLTGEYYSGEAIPGLPCGRGATLLRRSTDASWLSDLSFDLSIGLAPGSDAVNSLLFDQYHHCGGTSAFERGEFFGRIDLTSLAPRINIAMIDVKPGGYPNSINVKSKGVIPVAILGSADFDATQVNSSTVRFGPGEASPVRDGRVANANGDGYPDMLFHFRTQSTGITCGNTSASLSGETFAGEAFAGSDSMMTVGCKAK